MTEGHWSIGNGQRMAQQSVTMAHEHTLYYVYSVYIM